MKERIEHPGSGADAPSSAAPPEFPRAPKPGDLTPALKVLLAGRSLSADETAAAFEAMMTGQTTQGEIGALLALLATRTPTPAEILGAASVMRRHVDRVVSSCEPSKIVDTAGTGGAPKTFNVSTAAAIVAAGAGATVAKHGNRSRTGRGSAEVLRQLGVNVDADRTTQARCLETVGVCFCFAIHHHPATRHVMPVRMALGVPTIFNLLGPLTNPAGAQRQIMGVYDRRLVEPIAKALAQLGSVRAMVFHSFDGLDELSVSALNQVAHVEEGAVRLERLNPAELGFARAEMHQLVADDLHDAARIIRDVLSGEEQGPRRDMTLLKAAATLVVAGFASSMDAGVALAAEAIDSGDAGRTLEELATVSQA